MNRQASRGAWSYWILSVLLHAALVAAAVAYWFFSRQAPQPQRLAIEATVIGALPTTARPPALAVQPEPEPEAVLPEPLPEVMEPDPEPEPVVEDTAAAEAAARVAEERRLAEERVAAERKAAEEARRRQAELAAKEKAAREKADREKAAREAAERQRLAREKAARDEAERQRAQRESDLLAQLAAEERAAAARNSSLMQQYVAQITARIERAWIRPASATVGLKCEVRVTQVPGGAVTGVQVGRCNGDESVRQSIEAAVLRASPLPEPSDPALFERILVINFEPRN